MIDENNQLNLLDKTRELLKNSTLTVEEIARRSGLTYHWITSLRADRVRDPSVNRVQLLYETLTNTNLL